MYTMYISCFLITPMDIIILMSSSLCTSPDAKSSILEGHYYQSHLQNKQTNRREVKEWVLFTVFFTDGAGIGVFVKGREDLGVFYHTGSKSLQGKQSDQEG